MKNRILVIDDEYSVFDILKLTFGSQYILDWAANCTQVKGYLMVHAPDLVFLDLNLPNVSGESVCHEILNEKRLLDNVPIILLSAAPLHRMQAMMNEYPNVKGFVTKPWDIDDISKALEKFL